MSVSVSTLVIVACRLPWRLLQLSRRTDPTTQMSFSSVLTILFIVFRLNDSHTIWWNVERWDNFEVLSFVSTHDMNRYRYSIQRTKYSLFVAVVVAVVVRCCCCCGPLLLFITLKCASKPFIRIMLSLFGSWAASTWQLSSCSSASCLSFFSTRQHIPGSR